MQIRVRRFRSLAASLLAAGLVAAVAAQSAFADARDFTLVNNSSIALHAVYVAPASSSDWEEDLLGSDILPPGSSLDVTFPDEPMEAPVLVGLASTDGVAMGGSTMSGCVYNIKVIGANGEAGYLYAVDLCTASTVTFTDAASSATTQ